MDKACSKHLVTCKSSETESLELLRKQCISDICIGENKNSKQCPQRLY